MGFFLVLAFEENVQRRLEVGGFVCCAVAVAVDTEVWLGGLEEGGGWWVSSGRCSMVDFDRNLPSF